MSQTKIAVGMISASSIGDAKVLQGDGSWVTPASAGWNFIATSTASTSASLTVAGMNDTYDSYAIIGSQLLPATDNVDAWMRFGDGSIDSGGTDYSYTQRGQYLTNFYTTGSDGAAQMIMTSYSDGIGNATGEGYGFIAYIFQPSSGTQRTWMSGHGASLSTNNINFFVHRFGGARRSTISHTQVNYLCSSGNINSGRLTLWGIAHS